MDLQNEFGEQGLVVLALSDEEAGKVSDYVDQMGIGLRVAAGSPSSGQYGVKGIPASCLIGPDGKVVYFGHPSGISGGMVKEALKGAKPRSTNFLAVPPSKELAGRAAAVGKSMEQGKLGKALQSAKDLAGDAKATVEETADAQLAASEIEAYVGVLSAQAEGFVKSRDVLNALTVLDALAKEFGAAAPGAAAKKRADEIRKDPPLAKEIAAAEALAKAQEAAAKLGTSKAKAKFQEIAEKYKGTRAGDRAAAMARAKKD